MKILYISDRLNSPDGSAVHGREFVASVKRAGHQVITYPALRPEPDSPPRPVPASEKNLVYYLKKINWQTCKYYLRRASGHVSEILNAWEGIADSARDYYRLAESIRASRPDAIIYRVRLFNFAPFRVSRKYGIPVLCEVNTLKSIEEKVGGTAKVTALTRQAERRYIKAADGIFTVTSTIAKEIEKYGPSCKVAVIPNGVDTDKFDPAKFDRQESRKRLGLENKIVLGYVGSYKKWHGLDTSVGVIEALNRKDSRYHLLLIGSGACYNEIDRLIAGRKLNHCVTRISNIAHDKIPEHLAAFDYALMTYPLMDKFYYSPLKMFEYMSMAIPVVATGIGQIKEILTDGKNGILVGKPTVDNFVSAIDRYSDDKEVVGYNARNLAVNEYSWLANAEKIMSLCGDMLVAGRLQTVG